MSATSLHVRGSIASWRQMALLAGPAVSVLVGELALVRAGVPAEWMALMLWTVLVVAWSPLFFSVPALMLQDERDLILVGRPVWHRAVQMIPQLLAAGERVRNEVLLSLYGFTLAAGVLVVRF